MTLSQLERNRDVAIAEVRAWWDAEQLKGRLPDHTQAPAWLKYLAAFTALDVARSVAEQQTGAE